MTLIYLLKFLAVMASVAITDVIWALYFIEVSNKKAFKSGLWSSLIILFGAFITTEYIQDKTLIIAAVIGAFAGTFLVVKYKK